MHFLYVSLARSGDGTVLLFKLADNVLSLSLIPRPCVFVACNTKFAQRAWAHSSRDVCHSRIFTSPDNNVCCVAYIHVQWNFKLKQVKRV